MSDTVNSRYKPSLVSTYKPLDIRNRVLAPSELGRENIPRYKKQHVRYKKPPAGR